MSEPVRTAACACGQLSVAVRGDPPLVSMCHCRQCQRRTGSAFGVTAFFDRTQVENIEGEHRAWRRSGDSGRSITFHFCPVCGSTVFWEPQSRPQSISIAAGAFADPGFPGPARTVWTEARPNWLPAFEALPQHERNP